MNDLWRIIVLCLEQMLKIRKPLFDRPKDVTLIVSDGVRVTFFKWNFEKGDVTEKFVK